MISSVTVVICNKLIDKQKLRRHEQEQSATSMISAEMQYSNDDSSDDEELKMLVAEPYV